MSAPTPTNVEIGEKIPMEARLKEPMYIYTMHGCDACTTIKNMCCDYGIKAVYNLREDHEELVTKLTGGYEYVPVVINSDRVFIGGLPEFKKVLDVSGRKPITK